MDYWISRQGQTYGPYSEDVLRAWFVQGHINASVAACPIGGDKWQSVGELLTAVASPASAPTSGPETYAPEASTNEAPSNNETTTFCNHCGKPLEADARFCPECGKSTVQDSAAATSANGAAPSPEPNTQSPHMSPLPPVPDSTWEQISPSAFRNNSRAEGPTTKEPPSKDWGALALLGLPLLLLLVYPRPIGLLLLVIVTALIVFFEVRRQDARHASLKGATSAGTWAIFLALLWVAAYPMYLFQRRKYGLKPHGLLAIAVLAVLLTVYLGVQFSNPSSQDDGMSKGALTQAKGNTNDTQSSDHIEGVVKIYNEDDCNLIVNDEAKAYAGDAAVHEITQGVRYYCNLFGGDDNIGYSNVDLDIVGKCSTRPGCAEVAAFAIETYDGDTTHITILDLDNKIEAAHKLAILCPNSPTNNILYNQACANLLLAISWAYSTSLNTYQLIYLSNGVYFDSSILTKMANDYHTYRNYLAKANEFVSTLNNQIPSSPSAETLSYKGFVRPLVASTNKYDAFCTSDLDRIKNQVLQNHHDPEDLTIISLDYLISQCVK